MIRARNVAGLAALLDAIAEAGADRLGDPDFGFADPSAGRLLATRAALADARRRADDAAATQGLRITGVRSVTLAPRRWRTSAKTIGFRRAAAAAWNARRPRRPRSRRGFSSSPSGSGSCTRPRRCSGLPGPAWRGERQHATRGTAYLAPLNAAVSARQNTNAVETGRPPTSGRLPVPTRPVAQPAPGHQRRRATAVQVQSRLAPERRHQRGQLFQRQPRVMARAPVARDGEDTPRRQPQSRPRVAAVGDVGVELRLAGAEALAVRPRGGTPARRRAPATGRPAAGRRAAQRAARRAARCCVTPPCTCTHARTDDHGAANGTCRRATPRVRTSPSGVPSGRTKKPPTSASS